MAELFTEQETNIFSESVPTTFVSDDEKSAIGNQIKLAEPVLGKELTAQATSSVQFGNVKGAKNLIQEHDLAKRRQIGLDRIIQTASVGTADMIVTSIQEQAVLQADKLALEKSAVAVVKQTLPREITDIVDDNVLQTLEKRQVWATSLANILREVKTEEDAEGILSETLDFFKTVFYIEGAEGWFQGGVGSAVDDLRVQFAHGKNLPPEQQEAFLRGPVRKFLKDKMFMADNPQRVVDLMEAAADGSDVAKDNLSFWSAVEVLFLPLDLIGIGKIKNIGKGLGSKPMLADDLVDKSEKVLKENHDKASELSSMKAPFDESEGITGEVGKRLKQNQQRLHDTLANITAPASPDEVLRVAHAKFNDDFAGERILSSSIDMDSTGFVNLTVGTVKGLPFKSKKVAQGFIDKFKLEGSVVASSKGGFHVKLRQDLHGFDSSTQTSISWFKKNVGNIDSIISKPILAQARAVEGSAAAIISAGIDVIKHSMKIMGTKAGVDLNKIIQRGVDQSFWLSPKGFHKYYRRLHGKLPTQVETEAYFAFKQLNDFSYEIDVQRLHKEVIARGESSYAIGDIFINGAAKPAHSITKEGVNDVPIHIFESDVHGSKTVGKGSLTADNMVDLEKTHNIVKVSPSTHTQLFEDGVVTELTNWIAVPKNIKAKQIDPYSLLPYKNGGRRRNVSPSYLKVGKTKKTASGTVRVSDSTTHGSVSIKDAKRTASSMNEIFDAMKKAKASGDDIAKLDDLVEGMNLHAIGISTARQADEFFENHGLYKYDDIKFQGVRDRQQVDMGGRDVTSLIDESEDAAISPIRHSKNGKRGDRLMNLDGEESLIMDPLGAVIDSLDATAKYASVSGFRQSSLQFMEQRFGQYLVREKNGNPVDILNASLNKAHEGRKGLGRVIAAHQEYLKQILSRRTPAEDGLLSKIESVIDDAFDKGSEIRKGLDGDWIETGAGRNFVRGVVSRDPATRVKSLVFNSKLGLGNVASFIAQAATIPNVIAISPKFGLQASMRAFPARLAIAGGVDRKMLDYMAKGWKAGGFDSKEDFLEYINEFRHIGTGNISQNIAEIGGQTTASFSNGLMNKIVSAGRVPFNEGELLTRLTGYGTARMEWLAKGKGLATSEAGRLWIGNRTHDLILGYSASDLQLGFRGLAGIPTQFWSYPFRYTGALIGKTFTPAERFRLGMMNVLLYGAAGIPLVDYFAQEHVSGRKDLSYAEAKLITNGGIDSMLFALSDGKIDSNISGRLGGGGFFTEQMRGMLDKGTLEYITGASGSTTHGLVSTVANVFTGYAAFRNPTVDNFTALTWDILKAEISSLKSIDKTARAIDTGWLYTKSGQRYDRISTEGAISMFFGAPPQTYENGSLIFMSAERRRVKIKDLAAMVVSLNEKLQQAIANDKGSDTIAGYRSAIEALGIDARDSGIASDVNKKVIAITHRDGLLNKSIERMSLLERKTPDDSSGVGIQQQLVNKSREEEQ